MPVTAERHHAIAQFVFHEARLLDEQKWDEWMALFAADGMYWIPLVPDQQDAVNHASIMWEDALLRDVRVRRLRHRNAWSQQPLSRTAHVLGNVMVDADAELVQVRAAFTMAEWNRRGQRVLAGSCRHTLRPEGDSFRIVLKRVDLVDCQAPHDNLEVFV